MSPIFSVPSCTRYCSDRPEAGVDERFDHHAVSRAGWIGFELQKLRLVIENIDQLGNSKAGGGTGPDDFRFPAPFNGIQPIGGELSQRPFPDWRLSGRSY